MRPQSTYPNTTGDTVENIVLEWLRTELEDAEITGDDNFLDIGGHSLALSKLNKFLSDSFSLELDRQTLYDDTLSSAAKAARPTNG